MPAVTAPHQGTSYNPPLQSHLELLLIAHDKVHKEEEEKEKLASIKKASENGQRVAREENEGVASGMTLDNLENAESSASEDDGSAPITTSSSSRKTKKQKERAKKLRLEVSQLSEYFGFYHLFISHRLYSDRQPKRL